MAFNISQYNLTAYNAGSDGVVWLSVIFQEQVTPALGTSLEAYLKAIGNERVYTGDMLLGNGVYITTSGLETITEGVGYGMSSIVLGQVNVRESVSAECTIMSENNLLVEALEQVTQDIILGSDIYPKGSGAETINAQTITDKETYLIAEGYELVSASVNLEAVDISVCELNVTLAPGQRLVVDAINYNVILDGENAIWAQSGAWIDELTRETSSISVTASSGVSNLTASILYTERYL